jgi:hypothetical protein
MKVSNGSTPGVRRVRSGLATLCFGPPWIHCAAQYSALRASPLALLEVTLQVFADAARRSPCCAQARCGHPYPPVRRMRLTPGACGKNFLRFCDRASRRKPVVWRPCQTPLGGMRLARVFHAPSHDLAVGLQRIGVLCLRLAQYRLPFFEGFGGGEQKSSRGAS